MNRELANDHVRKQLDDYTGSHVPGLQYVVVNARQTLYEYAGGWADVQNQRAMTSDTTMMA